MRTTKCPRSTIESTSNRGQCLKSLEISKEAFYVFRRIKSENSWKWNKFKTVMYLPLSKHFPAAWSLPQNTAYFAFFLDFSHLFSESDHRDPWVPLTYHIPIKIREKNNVFTQHSVNAYTKAFEWEAKEGPLGGSYQTYTIFRICAQRYYRTSSNKRPGAKLTFSAKRRTVHYRKWSRDRKWSPKWTANDPLPQVIPKVNRKWSRKKIGMACTQVSRWSRQFYYYYKTSDLKRNFTFQINTWIKTTWKKSFKRKRAIHAFYLMPKCCLFQRIFSLVGRLCLSAFPNFNLALF